MSKYYQDEHRYDDIINLPHHRSKKRIPMSLQDRAAQFNPFAALNGHEEAIRETERLTEERMELDESVIEEINEKLYELSMRSGEKQKVSISYFKPDSRKAGGEYLTDVGVIKKIDSNEQLVVMENGVKISMGQIVGIEVYQETLKDIE